MTDKIQYASFFGRCGATIIDVILFLIITGIPLTMIYGDNYWGDFDGMEQCLSNNQQCEVMMMQCKKDENVCPSAIASCQTAKTLCTAFEQQYKSRPFIHGVWDVLLKFVFPFALAIWMWKKYRGTPAKCLFKMRIVDADSFQPITTKQAIGRYFAYIISMLPLFFGFFWILFDKRNQAFHDILSNTVVIREPSEG